MWVILSFTNDKKFRLLALLSFHTLFFFLFFFLGIDHSTLSCSVCRVGGTPENKCRQHGGPLAFDEGCTMSVPAFSNGQNGIGKAPGNLTNSNRKLYYRMSLSDWIFFFDNPLFFFFFFIDKDKVFIEKTISYTTKKTQQQQTTPTTIQHPYKEGNKTLRRG